MYIEFVNPTYSKNTCHRDSTLFNCRFLVVKRVIVIEKTQGPIEFLLELVYLYSSLQILFSSEEDTRERQGGAWMVKFLSSLCK